MTFFVAGLIVASADIAGEPAKNDIGLSWVAIHKWLGLGIPRPAARLHVREDRLAEVVRIDGNGQGRITFFDGPTCFGQIGFGGPGHLFTNGLPGSLGLRSNNALLLGTGATASLVIRECGYIHGNGYIGTGGVTKPLAQIHMGAEDSPRLSIESNTPGTGRRWSIISVTDGSFQVYNEDDHVVGFHASPDGRAGINTGATGPQGQFHVAVARPRYTGQVLELAAGQTADALQVRPKGTGATFKLDRLGRPVTANTTPRIDTGPGVGAAAVIDIAGTDVAGVITVTTGAEPRGSAPVATVTFSSAYTTPPQAVLITPADPNAAALSGPTQIYVHAGATTAASWTLKAGPGGLAPVTTYQWHYHIDG